MTTATNTQTVNSNDFIDNSGAHVIKLSKFIDLHLHLDGAISVNSVKELARLQGVEIPENEDELLKLMRFDPATMGLTDFFDKFAFPCSLLQTEETISTAVYNLCRELQEQGIIYAEIRFAPSKSCDKGLTQDQVIEAAINGMQKSGLPANIIVCCMRGFDYEINAQTVMAAKKYLGKGVCALDLAGPETLFPTKLYEDILTLAHENGIPLTIHAGEADGAESVWNALKFGAVRIDHGVRSVEDPLLVEYLAKNKIPLTICPTSNIHTCIFKATPEIPIRTFLNAGVIITINTDDPSIEGTDLKTEWEKVIKAFNLTPDEVKTIMLNSVTASFASDNLKADLRKQMEENY